jgi:hypothetical protein
VPDEDLIQFLNTPRGLNVLSVREEKVFRNFVNNNKTHEELRAELGVTEIGLHDYIAKLRLNINDVRESIPGVVPKRTPEQIRWLREQSADRAEDQIEKREELKLLTLMQPTSTQLIDKYETDLTEACELLAMEWWDKPAIEIRLAVEEAAALLHKLIDRYFISPLDNQPVHVVRYQDLKDYIIERLKAKIPNHRCAHQALWLHKCDVCDKVGYLPVNLEDPQAVNLLLSKLGFGKWAGYSKLCSYHGMTTNDGKLVHIDAAVQRDSAIGGKRVKPEGIASDDHQSNSAPDSDYAGTRGGPDYPGKTGSPVEGFNLNRTPELRELEPVDQFDRDPEGASDRSGSGTNAVTEEEPEQPRLQDLRAEDRAMSGPKTDADLF